MDAAFNEDRHRMFERNNTANLSATRRLAISILRRDTTTEVVSAKNKQFKAACNPNYTLEALENLQF